MTEATRNSAARTKPPPIRDQRRGGMVAMKRYLAAFFASDVLGFNFRAGENEVDTMENFGALASEAGNG